jgi:hypothetical protein
MGELARLVQRGEILPGATMPDDKGFLASVVHELRERDLVVPKREVVGERYLHTHAPPFQYTHADPFQTMNPELTVIPTDRP